MNTKHKPAVRWSLVAGYLGMVAVLLACGVSAGATPSTATTPTPTQAITLLRLEDGAVKVQGENQDWVPVAGQSTFELVGRLESTDPWMVTGNTFATRETTQIAEGLEVGDLVRVKGVILEDATWLASSIELIEEQTDTNPTILLIGKVNSTDPWVVNGITLNTTQDTVITGDIVPDMLVRVEILLLDDGTWEVLSIAPLGDVTEIPGCATVRATVERVNGNEIQFTGWPAITLGEEVKIEDEAESATTLSVGQSVLVVICATEDGQFVITKIVVLIAEDDESSGNGGKVLICHKPDKKGGHTLSVAEPAVPAHLAHGDKRGPCP